MNVIALATVRMNLAMVELPMTNLGVRPFLINILIPQEGAETNYEEPSFRSMGFASYFIYAAVLTLVHHASLFLLEALQFAGFFYFIIKTLLSVAISLLILLIVEFLFERKQRFRTNTA